VSSAREMRLRIQSVANIAQVTRAMQAVSASKVRRAQEAVMQTRPYATKAWAVLQHLATQPGKDAIHPLLTARETIQSRLVVLISGDRGLAGGYNTNVVRFATEQFRESEILLSYVLVGKKGRDLIARKRVQVQAEFSDLPDNLTYADISAVGRLVVDEYLEGNTDEVYIVYTDFVNMLSQIPVMKKLLPLEFDDGEGRVQEFEAKAHHPMPTYIYEPNQQHLLDRIIPSFTALQLYQAVLESKASEHAARMIAMQNATDNANELGELLQLEYNKARQQTITSEMLDIVGGSIQ